MTAFAPLDPEAIQRLRDEFARADATERASSGWVARTALVASVPDAARGYEVARQVAAREIMTAKDPSPRDRSGNAAARRADQHEPSAAVTVLQVLAAVLALVGPALVFPGRGGAPAFGAGAGAVPSALCMLAALLLFAVLEPMRTRSRLYRTGSLAGGIFIFLAVVWALAAAEVFVHADGAATALIGGTGQAVCAAGSIGLAVVAIRNDRRRPQALGGDRVARAPHRLPPDVDAAVTARMDEWAAEARSRLTGEEHGRVAAAEQVLAGLAQDAARGRPPRPGA